ncbi:MAG: DUF5615 family PIN-like protein [Lewinellaceae bacterium]|nr:DUF5615 family PIN-like protein [Lewinellaceae bacterium]MCB9334469.1 DUF5615 family PIN-like protein [Lewinellaceae bacterium]
MTILLDQNISFRLLNRLGDAFPDTTHIRLLGLTNHSDYQIFMYARREGIDAIITLDEDFSLIQLEHGTPPKIIWLRTGNCSTTVLAQILLENTNVIQEFLADNTHDCLEIYK